ncbi:hypothetical protein QQP08_018420 [Theobroma cacao]|nr:hypothetical protein QQP08_018420 [Theobroma cacao]
MSFGLVSCRSMSAGQTGILFVHPEDNVTYKLSSTLTVLPPGSSSVDELSHIPSPYGAASLPLPSGTGHETYIQMSTKFPLFFTDASVSVTGDRNPFLCLGQIERIMFVYSKVNVT